jgi:hypothetical protein
VRVSLGTGTSTRCLGVGRINRSNISNSPNCDPDQKTGIVDSSCDCKTCKEYRKHHNGQRRGVWRRDPNQPRSQGKPPGENLTKCFHCTDKNYTCVGFPCLRCQLQKLVCIPIVTGYKHNTKLNNEDPEIQKEVEKI